MRFVSLFVFLALAACSSRSTGSVTSDSGTSSDMDSVPTDASSDDLGAATDASLDAHVVDMSPTDASAFDASTADAQPGDSGTSSDGDTSSVDGGVCAFVEPLREAGCGSDEDCRMGLHQINCCGTRIAVGFKAADEATFSELEPTCAASYPRCRCAIGPTATDSGETVSPGEEEAIQVACVPRADSSVCLTYVSERPAED